MKNDLKSMKRAALMAGASMMVMGAFVPVAMAQDEDAASDDTIVITGIRASLDRAMDIKRNANGVVDAISAEDIGKFPNTNLAESLQRITGVSINRVAGEGSEVTVRGFGPGFNLVTLNGRTMPTANIATVGGDQGSDFAGGGGRSFDFSNLAAEGVSALEVYKTGRAAIPTGGIGATVNIATVRPLDAGSRASIAGKLMHDTGVENGEELTPEVSGIYSWVNDADTFGVSIFGSYQERDGSLRAGTVNGWNIDYIEDFVNSGAVNDQTTYQNTPEDGTLVAYPNDSRYHFSEYHRERLNGQATIQFRPMDNLTLTADATFAQNSVEEQRTDQTNWFNRPFRNVIFDSADDGIATTVYLDEIIDGMDDGMVTGVKDMGFEQQYRGNEDKLQSFGFNAEWGVTDAITLNLDAHTSKSESNPDNPNGASSTLFSMGARVIAAHSLDFRSGFPVQMYEFNDTVGGNGNGQLDEGDLGSQVAREISNSMEQEVDEVIASGTWEFDNGYFEAGLNYRNQVAGISSYQTEQTLGGWGIANVGDVEEFGPGIVDTYCLSCLYDDYNPGMAETAFIADATELYNALSPAYVDMGEAVRVTTDSFNEVEEEIMAAFAQVFVEGTLGDMPFDVLAGIRWEQTDVTSFAAVAPTSAVIWLSDNDFTRTTGSADDGTTLEGSYTNVLPSLDFKIDLRPDLVGRASFSTTLARPSFGNLYGGVVPQTPARPTYLGGEATANIGNPGLAPLESNNFDASLEWYFDESSFVSFGVYEKRVQNFVGSGVTTQNLFGLRDVSSGEAGRSGQAVAELMDLEEDITDVTLFTMTALIDNFGVAEGRQRYIDNYINGDNPQQYAEDIYTAYDLTPNADDPLLDFAVTQPINNREARLYGFEIAGQHFFGDTGFGVAGSYTSVDGDVEIDNAADPDIDQFALLGLSDTYNITGIYENYGFSVRLAYNWRDQYLAQTGRGGNNRNPVYFDEFGQVDLSVSYDFNDNLQFSFDAINLNEEGVKTFGRDENNIWLAQELDTRYLFGARYQF